MRERAKHKRRAEERAEQERAKSTGEERATHKGELGMRERATHERELSMRES